VRIKSVALGSEPLPGVDAMAGGSSTRLDDVDVRITSPVDRLVP
jgi:hypothetical protein